MQTILFLSSTFVLTTYFVFGVAGAFASPARRDALEPELQHLWRISIAFLLTALYLEISQ